MKYFVFRNQTVEAFFGDKSVIYSGYDDISIVPDSADSYIWFYQVPPGESAKVAKEVATFFEKLELVLQRVSQEKQFIIFTLESIANICTVSSDFSLQFAIDDFNRQAFELAHTHNHIKLVNFHEFTEQYPKEELVNWKFFFISQTLLNPKLSKDFRLWWQQKENEFILKRKKCLVLDLDNTLWGGILGEDGLSGIKIGGDYPGNAFLQWQNALLELKNSGVVLAVCSKNNEQDVFEALEKNPFIALRKEHFVAFRINWQDKATNIRELADELNIGLDSMVFIDDNPTERALIRHLLPMVEVPEFPSNPYQLMSFYDELVRRYFQVYSITNEDRQKTEQYNANAERAKAKASFTDLSDYLRSLDMRIEISSLDEFNLPRIAQLTQKTNQFNLTTHRYTENDIRQMSSDGCLIYCVNVSDKFGDNGITGVIILRPENSSLMNIDTLLLSCRILGKNIEFAFLDSVLNLVMEMGVKSVQATYIKTAKNSQVADFFDRAGFILLDNTEETKQYHLQLDNHRDIKDYYSITIK